MKKDDHLENITVKPESENQALEPAPEKAADRASERKSWSDLNQNLKQALQTWDVLSEQMESKVSPEETQLREVKRLLSELKDKLKQFSD